MPATPALTADHRIREDMTTAVRALVRLSKAVENVLAEDQLSVSQFRIFERLADGSTQGRTLADWLAVKPPSLTTLVDGLVRRGLVSRSESGEDRRQVTHTLTAAGQQLHHEVSERIATKLRTILGHLGDDEIGAEMIASLAAWDPAITAAREAKHRDGQAAAR